MVVLVSFLLRSTIFLVSLLHTYVRALSLLDGGVDAVVAAAFPASIVSLLCYAASKEMASAGRFSSLQESNSLQAHGIEESCRDR